MTNKFVKKLESYDSTAELGTNKNIQFSICYETINIIDVLDKIKKIKSISR